MFNFRNRKQPQGARPGATSAPAAGGRGRRPTSRTLISPSTRRSLIATAVIAIIAIIVVGTSAFWMNWWWFGSVGYRSVLVTRYIAQFGMFFAFGFVAAGFFLANTFAALRRARAALAVPTGRASAGLIDRIMGPLLLVAGGGDIHRGGHHWLAPLESGAAVHIWS